MGNLRLWKGGVKGKNYKFLDKIIAKHFNTGGTGMYIHKYVGPKSQNSDDPTISSDPNTNELTIQDVLLFENRDRKYDPDITELKGHYDIQQTDFNLTQFGFTIAGATVFIVFHINDMVERLGRRVMSGDVIELRHRRDDLLLDPDASPLNAFYVVKDATRASDGYSATWFPHIWRCKCEPLKDSQEFKDIFDRLNNQRIQLSTNQRIQLANDQVDLKNQQEVDRDGMDSSHLYVDPDGNIPGDNMINYVFNGDGIPPNADIEAEQGTFFPEDAVEGEYFIRTDYNPPRLFRKQECKWRMIETVYRQQYQTSTRTLEEFVDNPDTVSFGGSLEQQIKSRQPVSKVNNNRKRNNPPRDCEPDTSSDLE